MPEYITRRNINYHLPSMNLGLFLQVREVYVLQVRVCTVRTLIKTFEVFAIRGSSESWQGMKYSSDAYKMSSNIVCFIFCVQLGDFFLSISNVDLWCWYL